VIASLKSHSFIHWHSYSSLLLHCVWITDASCWNIFVGDFGNIVIPLMLTKTAVFQDSSELSKFCDIFTCFTIRHNVNILSLSCNMNEANFLYSDQLCIREAGERTTFLRTPWEFLGNLGHLGKLTVVRCELLISVQTGAGPVSEKPVQCRFDSVLEHFLDWNGSVHSTFITRVV